MRRWILAGLIGALVVAAVGAWGYDQARARRGWKPF